MFQDTLHLVPWGKDKTNQTQLDTNDLKIEPLQHNIYQIASIEYEVFGDVGKMLNKLGFEKQNIYSVLNIFLHKC